MTYVNGDVACNMNAHGPTGSDCPTILKRVLNSNCRIQGFKIDTHAVLVGNSRPCVGRRHCQRTLTCGPSVIAVGLKAGSAGPRG